VKVSWVTVARSVPATVIGAALVAVSVWGVSSFVMAQAPSGDLVPVMRTAVAIWGPSATLLCALAVAFCAAAWGPEGMTGALVGTATLGLAALAEAGYALMAASAAQVGPAAVPVVAPMALMVLIAFALLALLLPSVGLLTVRAGVARWHADAPAPTREADDPVR
jgi:hypothetical protein